MESKELHLAWLAGIVDGEGYVAMNTKYDSLVSATPKRGAGVHLDCYIKVEATSMAMIAQVAKVLEEFGIRYYLGRPTPKTQSARSSSRVEIYHKKDLLLLCELLIPHSIVKKQEIQLLALYLRKAVAYKRYRVTSSDLVLAGKIRELRQPIEQEEAIAILASLTGNPKFTSEKNEYGNPELAEVGIPRASVETLHEPSQVEEEKVRHS